MMKKLFALSLVSAFLFVSIMVPAAAEGRTDGLAAMLPDSDGVIVVDARRLFDEALPQILSANQPMLLKVNGEVDKIRSKTGLDLRKFERVAVGVKTKKVTDDTMDFQPLVLARGNSDGRSLEEAAKMASEGEVRTETIAGRTVYVFSAKEIVDRNKPAGGGNSFFEKLIDKVLGGMSDEVALTAYDEDTVAIGSLGRVRELLGDAPRISSKMLEMLNQKQTAVANFGMVLPEGLSRFLELEDDELGVGLDSIREMQGSMDVVPGKTVVSIAARTADVEQAENLEVMLQGFQGVFSAILKKQKGADKKVYGRMLQNLSVDRNEDRLLLDLEIPQRDLDVIIGKK